MSLAHSYDRCGIALLALVWINIFLGLSVGYAYYNNPSGVARAIEQIPRLVIATVAPLFNPRPMP
jgi:hypothetical protein